MAKSCLDAVSRYRKIEDLTSAKDDAPPVWLADELAELAASSHEQAECIAEHISKRLATKSPIIVWKALRLIRHMCNRGCTQFQRCMQRYSASVREQLHFQGDKDPFKGDSLNQRVRETAKETIEALYSSAPPPVTSASTAPKGRIQGFGSCSSAGPSAVSNTDSFSSRPQPQSGSSKMVGFGSDGRSHTMQPPPSPSSELTSSVSSAVNNLSGLIRSQFPSGHKEHTSALHQRTGSYGESTYVDFASGGGGASAVNMPGRRIGQSASLAPGNLRGQPANVSAVMGTEEQLVGDICAPVGLRPAPDPEDLRKFVESASSMDGLRIGELLLDKMTSPSWQVVLRSLHALEAVLLHGSSQACGEVAVMFQSDPSPVTRALSSGQASVKERASCCLRLLLNEEVHDMPAARSQQSATQLQASAFLLDFDSGDGRQHAAGPAPTVTAPASQAPMDFLGELDSAPAVTSTGPSFQQPLASQAHDPFSAMDMSGLHISVPSIAPAHVVQAAAGPSARTPQSHAAEATAVNGPAARATEPLDDFFSSLPSSVSASAGSMPPRQQPGHPAGFGVLPAAAPGVSSGYSHMQQGSFGFGSLQGPSPSPCGLSVAGSHGAAGGSQLQQQQQGSYSTYVVPSGSVGMHGATTGPSASSSMGFGGPVPAAGSTGDGSNSAAGRWAMPHAQAAASLWMTPMPHAQPSAASQQQGLLSTGSKASDSAFDFVKDILK